MNRKSDLTGFAALLGESLSARVDLLERLLQEAHYPSIGQYKERLLADTIRGYLPTSVQVGTGFVLFPHEDEARAAGVDTFDPLNQSAYSISRQCDIIVYDVTRFPPVFRDGDFVVIRPEAARAIIEVKGSLNVTQMKEALDNFKDFGHKWRTTQLFYMNRSQTMTPSPGLFLMAWRLQQRNGRNVVTPTRLRRLIAEYYATNVPRDMADGFPYMSKLLIHDECEISAVHSIDGSDEEYQAKFGWLSQDGRFIRISPSGELYRDKDRTIASLLAALHWNVAQTDFNRFFSYTDEVRHPDLTPYQHAGVNWAYEDLASREAQRFTSKVPQNHT